jgi:hypothetical protein
MDDDDRKKKREYMREWRKLNPQHREYQKRYHDAYSADPENAEAARQRAKAWYYQNRDRVLSRAKARYADKPKNGYAKGEAHHSWKGENVGYHALHKWVDRELGKPSRCAHCDSTSELRFEWANIDHQYRRVLGDWLRLCTSCHRRYDYENGLAKKGGRRRKT